VLESRRRTSASLLVLAAATFVYVTAETFPVGLLPQLARGLHVSEGDIGLLVTVYAVAAGLAALPVTLWTRHLPRRTLVAGAVSLLALSQFAIAVAPNYGLVMGARIVCAIAHGVFWAVLAPVAASLVPPHRAGRATAIVFTGNSLALVLGTPLATAIGQLLGWRAAAALVGVAGVLTVVGLVLVLPRLPSTNEHDVPGARAGALGAALRRRSVLGVSAVTALVVTGHFAAYTYIAALVRHDAGIAGLALSGVLLGYGVAGIAGTAAVGLAVDRRPRAAIVGCVGATSLALALLAAVGHGSVLGTVGPVLVWGAAFTAIPVCVQSAVLRVAPDVADTASAVLVVAFQAGIGGGALAGSFLVGSGGLDLLPIVGAICAGAATVVALRARQAFPLGHQARSSVARPSSTSSSSLAPQGAAAARTGTP
jgi:predicted MFS family arabinose efflux permease